MTDEARVTVDTSQVNALLQELSMSDDDSRKAIRSALRDSANIVKQSAVRGLSSVSSDPRKRKGIKISVYKNASGARVDIMHGIYLGDDKTRPFALHWFENGTGMRYSSKHAKTGARRGAMPARPFFEQAAGSSHQAAESSLEKLIVKRIIKVAQNRK